MASMMPSRRGFRILVIVGFLLGIAGMVDTVFPSLLPSDARALFDAAKTKPVETYWKFMATLSVVFSLAQLVAIVGVILFRRWGRHAYTILTVGGILLLPFYQVLIASGFSSMFGAASTVVAGMVITLMYLPPVREFFW